MSRVLITGCSSGFGFEAAKAFRGRGDDVFATVRDLQIESVAELRALGVTPVVLDVSDDVAVEQGVARVLAGGPLDALVNNAGIYLQATVEETSDAQAYRMFETNVLGPLRMIRAVLPSMRARKKGVIVNISSTAGIAAFPRLGLYAASKFALTALSEALYLETKPFGIRVRLVEPGNFPTTDIFRKALGSARDFGSPYEAHVGAFWSALSSFQGAAPAPDVSPVIEAMWRAVHDPASPFQQPVGAEAQALADARRGQSFETIERIVYQTIGLHPAV